MDTQLHQHITTISNGGGSAVDGRVIGGNGVVSIQRDDEYRERMLKIRRLLQQATLNSPCFRFKFRALAKICEFVIAVILQFIHFLIKYEAWRQNTGGINGEFINFRRKR